MVIFLKSSFFPNFVRMSETSPRGGIEGPYFCSFVSAKDAFSSQTTLGGTWIKRRRRHMECPRVRGSRGCWGTVSRDFKGLDTGITALEHRCSILGVKNSGIGQE
jgi:hypothetical protein